MRPESRARLAFSALVLSLAALAAGCGGSRTETIRIGVVSDCEGFFSAAYEDTLAGAELPLIERGAKLKGPKPSDGIEGAFVVGKPVELVFGCERTFNRATTIAELRRVVEEKGADLVVGPNWNGDGEVVRDYARRHPGVTFLVNDNDQSTTLKDSAPNVFRFRPDLAQWAAGLGTYAYRKLGWRRAVTIGGRDFGWSDVAGFVAEFCSLGGNVVRLGMADDVDFGALASRIPVRGVDGVFIPDIVWDTRGFVAAWAARRGDLARSLVAGDVVLAENRDDPRMLGVVGSNTTPWTNRGQGIPPATPGATTRAWSAYLDGLARAFPKMKVNIFAAIDDFDGMEPLLEALEQVHGDLSHGERRLMTALARLKFDSPEGQRRVDSRHQEVGSMYLGRVEMGARGKLVVRQIRAVPNVEQTFGGYFSATSPAPSRTQPACKHGHPPSWAR